MEIITAVRLEGSMLGWSGSRLVTVTEENQPGELSVWDSSGRLLHRLTIVRIPLSSPPCSFNGSPMWAISPDGRSLATVDYWMRQEDYDLHDSLYTFYNSANHARLWDISSGVQYGTLSHRCGEIACLAFSHRGERLALASRFQIDIFAIPGGEHQVSLPTEQPAALAFSPDGVTIAVQERGSTGIDWRLCFWRLAGSREEKLHEVAVRSSIPYPHRPHGLGFSPEGRFLALRLDLAHLILVDVSSGRLRTWPHVDRLSLFSDLQDHEMMLSPLSWQFIGDSTLVIASESEVCTWDLKSERRLGRSDQPRGTTATALSPDGTIVASALPSRDGRSFELRLISRGQPQPFALLELPIFPVYGLAFSPGGTHVAASCENGKTWVAPVAASEKKSR